VLQLSQKDRKVLVRVLPNNGYKMEVEINKDTSINEVIKTLQELGFSYEEKDISTFDVELFNQLYDSFVILSQEYGDIISSNMGLYKAWLKFGFNLIDIKNPLNEESIMSNETLLNSNLNNSDVIETTLDYDKHTTVTKQDSEHMETKDNCDYCDIFKNLNSYVCPQCGKALNISSSLNDKG
jgi:hypothetical protein